MDSGSNFDGAGSYQYWAMQKEMATLRQQLEAANGRSEYWKAEHLAGNELIAQYKADAERWQFLINTGQTANGTFKIDCLAPSYLQFEAAIDSAIAAAAIGKEHP